VGASGLQTKRNNSHRLETPPSPPGAARHHQTDAVQRQQESPANQLRPRPRLSACVKGEHKQQAKPRRETPATQTPAGGSSGSSGLTRHGEWHAGPPPRRGEAPKPIGEPRRRSKPGEQGIKPSADPAQTNGSSSRAQTALPATRGINKQGSTAARNRDQSSTATRPWGVVSGSKPAGTLSKAGFRH